MNTFFFDTYALYEIYEGKESYKDYMFDISIITTPLNLMELHYVILIKKGKEIADKVYDRLVKFAVVVTDEIIKEANSFRALHKKNKLSYVDCIGYVLAKSRNVKFLTGDKEFENLDNVEFVK